MATYPQSLSVAHQKALGIIEDEWASEGWTSEQSEREQQRLRQFDQEIAAGMPIEEAMARWDPVSGLSRQESALTEITHLPSPAAAVIDRVTTKGTLDIQYVLSSLKDYYPYLTEKSRLSCLNVVRHGTHLLKVLQDIGQAETDARAEFERLRVEMYRERKILEQGIHSRENQLHDSLSEHEILLAKLAETMAAAGLPQTTPDPIAVDEAIQDAVGPSAVAPESGQYTVSGWAQKVGQGIYALASGGIFGIALAAQLGFVRSHDFKYPYGASTIYLVAIVGWSFILLQGEVCYSAVRNSVRQRLLKSRVYSLSLSLGAFLISALAVVSAGGVALHSLALERESQLIGLFDGKVEYTPMWFFFALSIMVFLPYQLLRALDGWRIGKLDLLREERDSSLVGELQRVRQKPEVQEAMRLASAIKSIQSKMTGIEQDVANLKAKLATLKPEASFDPRQFSTLARLQETAHAEEEKVFLYLGELDAAMRN